MDELKPKWTKRQAAALRDLEQALARCKGNGICFVGMDDNLLAYAEKDLDAAIAETVRESGASDLYEAQNKCGQGVRIDTSDAYRDSGGW